MAVWNGIPPPLSASGTLHLDDCANTNALAVKHSFNQDCASDEWEPAQPTDYAGVVEKALRFTVIKPLDNLCLFHWIS